MERAVVSVLGPVRVTVDGDDRKVAPSSRRLLAELVFAGRAGVTVGGFLEAWPTASRASLQTIVWRLRRLLGPDAITTERDRYCLDPACATDLADFRAATDAGCAAFNDGAVADATDLLGAALGLWREDPAPVAASEEGVAARLEAIERRSVAMECWAQASIRTGRPADAAQAMVTLTAEQPLRELAWATLVEAYEADGQPELGAAAATEAITVLAASGLDPSPRLAAAVGSVGAVSLPPAAGELPPWLAAARSDRSFVGREAEIDEILAAVEQARAGTTSMVLVAGEAGVGKTRLLAEAAGLASARGLAVWGGRWDRHQSIPYRGLVEALDAVIAGAPAGPVGAVLRGRLGPLLRPGSIASAVGDDTVLFEGVADLLDAVTRRQPGVLVLDDVHWASLPSLLLLREVVRSRPAMSLCILVGQRTSDPIDPELREVFDELGREQAVRWVELAGLAPLGVAGMPEVAAMAELLRDDLRELAEWLVETTGGNALFIDRLLDSPDFLSDLRVDGASLGGWPRRSPVEPPARVASVVASHVAHLSEATTRILGTAAMMGPDVDLAVLQQVVGEQVADAVADGHAARLLVGEGRRVRFAHDLIAVGLVAALPEAERAAAHLRIADVLEAGATADEPADLFAVAHHLAQAGTAALASRVSAAATRAGRLAHDRLEFGLATRSFETAAAYADAGEVVTLLVSAAEAAVLNGDVVRARSVLDRAEKTARASSRPTDLARVAIAAGDLALRSEGALDDATCSLAREALPRLEPGTDAQVEAALAFLVALADDRPQRLPATIEGFIDPAMRVDYARRAMDVVHIEAETRLRSIVAEAGTVDGAVLASQWGWMHDLQHGRATLGDGRRLAELAALAEQPDVSLPARWWARAWRATTLIGTGHFDEGAAEADRVARMGRADVDAFQRMRALLALRLQQVSLGLYTGAPGAITADVVDLDPMWTRGLYATQQWQAWTLSWDADRASAIEVLSKATPQLVRRAGYGGGWLLQLAVLGGSAYACGDLVDGAAIAAALEPWRGQHALRVDAYAGAIDHTLGILWGMLGDLDGAIDALQAAYADEMAVGAVPFATLSRMQLVLHLRRRGRERDVSEAEAILPDVLDHAERLGMPRVKWMLSG